MRSYLCLTVSLQCAKLMDALTNLEYSELVRVYQFFLLRNINHIWFLRIEDVINSWIMVWYCQHCWYTCCLPIPCCILLIFDIINYWPNAILFPRFLALIMIILKIKFKKEKSSIDWLEFTDLEWLMKWREMKILQLGTPTSFFHSILNL